MKSSIQILKEKEDREVTEVTGESIFGGAVPEVPSMGTRPKLSRALPNWRSSGGGWVGWGGGGGKPQKPGSVPGTSLLGLHLYSMFEELGGRL